MLFSATKKFVLLSQLLLLEKCHAAGVTSKLQIHIPKALQVKGGYDHREALFGSPPYGGAIQQSVYYADSDLCEHDVNTHIGYPARDKDESGKMLSWQSPFILMVDRGSCTFVQKVRNAQRAGAAGVIIADNTCLCSAGATCKSDAMCETQEPIMSDDGSGSDVSIPSFLMFKQDADPVIEVLKNNTSVLLEMSWALPAPDDRVEYDLFTAPTDALSRTLKNSFKSAAVALGEDARFTPHMYIYDGITAGCQDFEGENQCYNLCTNNGRYCATDPDEDLDKGVSGADVVKESLRRICIWKQYGEADGIGVPWWDYVHEFSDKCLDDPAKFVDDDGCVKEAMVSAGIDAKKIAKCVNDDSGGLEANGLNNYLEEELDGKEKFGVIIVPSMFVNAAAIRGAPGFSTAFRAICAGYALGFEPMICTMCMNCLDEYTCVEEDGVCPGDKSGKGAAAGSGGGGLGVSVHVFALSLLALMCLFSCTGFIVWKRMQRHMQEQVRGVLAEYMPIDENNRVQQDTSVGIVNDDDDLLKD